MDITVAQRITESQQRLYGYIYSLIGNSANSWDILQETNLVLWKKQDQFEPGSQFDSWAFTIARYQVLAFLRDKNREPLCILTPEHIEAFSELSDSEARKSDIRLKALKSCKDKLSIKNRRLVSLYYEQGMSIKDVGNHLHSSATAVKQALFRTRRALLDCIESSLASEP